MNQPVPPDPHIAVWAHAALGARAVEFAIVVGHDHESTWELGNGGVRSRKDAVLQSRPLLICIELHEAAVCGRIVRHVAVRCLPRGRHGDGREVDHSIAAIKLMGKERRYRQYTTEH